MKRNLLGLFAIALVVAFSAFTAPRVTNVYFQYNSGAQDDMGNYTQFSSRSAVDGSDILAWIRIADDNGTVSADEFEDAFLSLNTVVPGTASLDNDIEKTITSTEYAYQVQLEKKAL